MTSSIAFLRIARMFCKIRAQIRNQSDENTFLHSEIPNGRCETAPAVDTADGLIARRWFPRDPDRLAQKPLCINQLLTLPRPPQFSCRS